MGPPPAPPKSFDLLFERHGSDGQSYKCARFVDELAVRLTVGMTADPPALRRFRRIVDVPLRERRAHER